MASRDQNSFYPMGPVSEAMFVMEPDSCPLNSYNMMRFSGRLDIQAMKGAVRETVRQNLFFSSRLEQRRIGLNYYLGRVPVDEMPELELLDDFADDLKGRTHLEAVGEMLGPRTETHLDLFQEPGARFFLARFPNDLYSLVIYFHHVCSDAVTMMGMYRDIFAAYHERVMGEKPGWARTEVMPSSSRAVVPKVKTGAVFSGMLREWSALLKNPLIRFGHVEKVDNPNRRVHPLILSEDETLFAVGKAKKIGVTFNDLVSSTVVSAIDEMLGLPHGTLSIWIPANVRSNSPEDACRANFSSAINVNLIRSERMDAKALPLLFAKKRKANLESGRPFANIRMLRRVLGFARLFPVHARKNILRKMFSQPITFMVSNVGVLWPRRVDGKLTMYSVLDNICGLKMQEYEMSVATYDYIGHGMVAFTFNGRFSALYSVYEQVLSKSEGDRFMDILKAKLLE